MDNTYPFNGISFNGFPVNNPVMEAAMACVQVLSRMKLEDKVRFHVLGKFFEGLGAVPSENFRSKSQGDECFYSNIPDSGGHPSWDSSKARTVIDLLLRALSNGALQLTDVVAAVQTLEKTCSDRTQRQDDFIQGDSTTSKESLPALENLSFKFCNGKLTENVFEKEGTVEKVTPHDPMDNNQPVITLDSGSHAAAFPKDRVLSLSTEMQGQKQSPLPSIHVTQVAHCFQQTLAGGGGLQNVLTPHAKSSGSPLLNKKVCFQSFDNNHVSSSPISSLEATKHDSKISSSPSPLNGKELDSQQASDHSNGSLIFKVDHDILQKRTDLCRFSVLGKLSLAKGDKPWIWKNLKKKLDEVWGMKEWRLISIGKGFFHIILNNQEDLCKVWNKGALRLKPGILRLQQWHFGFDPAKEKTTFSPVWFRILQLPWCLWDSSVINGIARKVGVPLRIDRNSLEGSFGHYARVLVEVDLSKQVPSKVVIDCCERSMEVSIVPENLPSFCHGCKSFGHSDRNCRALFKKEKGPQPSYSIKAAKKTLSGKNGDERVHKTSSAVARNDTSWRRKEAKESNSDKSSTALASNDDSSLSEKVTKFSDIVETVTDFSAQDYHPSQFYCHDRILLSNQFSVLEMDDEVEEKSHNSENVSHQEPISLLCEDEEIIIPKLPQRWSDILDDDNEVEAAPMSIDFQSPVNEVLMPPHSHSSNEMETILTHGLKPISMGDQIEESTHSHPRKDISELRAQLDNIWVERDDSRYDRDMYAELDRGPYSPKLAKPLINLLPKKERKLKIGFRQPQRHLNPLREI